MTEGRFLLAFQEGLAKVDSAIELRKAIIDIAYHEVKDAIEDLDFGITVHQFQVPMYLDLKADMFGVLVGRSSASATALFHVRGPNAGSTDFEILVTATNTKKTLGLHDLHAELVRNFQHPAVGSIMNDLAKIPPR